MTETSPSAGRARIAVLGVHGFGGHHLADLARSPLAERAEVVATVDPRPLRQAQDGAFDGLPGVPHHADLRELLATEAVDVVVVATPINTHRPLAELALRSGADVLLEKPPVTSSEDLAALQRVEAETGRRVQVGFQTFGAAAVAEVAELVAGGAVGTVSHLAAVGCWVRRESYWQRSRWAGRRALDGVVVLDGVVSNPLAHATATALRIAGADRADDVVDVEADLYRANPIEADDTSTVLITTTGIPVLTALTLCAEADSDPYVEVFGDRGRIRLHYTEDVIELSVDGAEPRRWTNPDRTPLLSNLIDHRRTGAELWSPLERSGAFTRVMDAIGSTTPRPIAPSRIEPRSDDRGPWPHVIGIEALITRAAESGRTFSGLGVDLTAPDPSAS